MSQDIDKMYKECFYDMPIDLCCVLNAENRQILQANISFEYILGWKPDEVVGQVIDALAMSETDTANIEKAFSKMKLGVHSFTFEMECKTKNNLHRAIDWKCYINTEKQWIFAIGRDVTELKDAQKKLLQRSHADQVTGLNDRPTFLTVLQTELHGAVRYHYAMAVLLIDVDHFRDFNLRYGTQKGDEHLKQIANILKTCLRRKTDFLARYDGDSFAVLLSHNDLEKALKVAEYLRASLEKHTISISLGVSAISDKQEKEISSDQMLSTVQRALNISQQHGGNQVNYTKDFV